MEEKFLAQWRSLIHEFKSLDQTRVPRCYFNSFHNAILFELHGFTDASSQAYRAIVCLRKVYDDGDISSTIVTFKTCIAPVKTRTIPRQELLIALILTRLVSTVKKSFTSLPNLTCDYWTNSTVALCWNRNHKPLRQYVSHRVNEIRCYSVPEE